MSISIRRQGGARSLQPQGTRDFVEAARPIRPSRPAAHDETIHGRIQARAYQIYLGRVRSGIIGDAVSDWYQAERELDREAAVTGTPAEIMVKAPGRADSPARSE